MNKINIPNYPMVCTSPVMLAGALVDGKPDAAKINPVMLMGSGIRCRLMRVIPNLWQRNSGDFSRIKRDIL
jgi:hypothetical protein